MNRTCTARSQAKQQARCYACSTRGRIRQQRCNRTFADLAVTHTEPRGVWIASIEEAKYDDPVLHRWIRAWTTWEKRPRLGCDVVCGKRWLNARSYVEPPEAADFCERCLIGAFRVHVVYRLYDADDNLLYVGYSGNLGQRLERHYSQSSFGNLIARVAWDEYPTEHEALVAEYGTSKAMGPRYHCTTGNANYRRIYA